MAIPSLNISSSCALDSCLMKGNLSNAPQREAWEFCSRHLQRAISMPETTIISMVTATGLLATAFDETSIVTVTVGIVCTKTIVDAPYFTTSMGYKSGVNVAPSGLAIGPHYEEPSIPPWFSIGCGGVDNMIEKVERACSCFLDAQNPTESAAPTRTIATTAFAFGLDTIEVSTTTATFCTSEETVSITNARPTVYGTTFTAYPSASVTGAVTCANIVSTPSANARIQVEGDQLVGTIFEDCAVGGARNVSTPIGGKHRCDGTNSEANENPGTTPINLLSAAAEAGGFEIDGPWIVQSDDFIHSIGGLEQRGRKSWNFWDGVRFMAEGGCLDLVHNGDRLLWAYDGVSKPYVLNVEPEYAVAEAGNGAIQLMVTDKLSSKVMGGATMNDVTSDNHGRITIPVPARPGCYQMKAKRGDAVSSNAFYLTVVDKFLNETESAPDPA
ncbi:hypothetical protein F4809DRAFT_642224 [Biscogniauxia mediterranea]|nr:hypothetical protein F4809DRAFT_642224 [Biscogniauxia mediterranea]